MKVKVWLTLSGDLEFQLIASNRFGVLVSYKHFCDIAYIDKDNSPYHMSERLAVDIEVEVQGFLALR